MTDRPRITFVDQSGQPGGAELMLLDVARAWRDRCRVVLLQDGPFAEALMEAGVEVQVIGLGQSASGLRKGGGPVAALRGVPAVLRCVRQLAAMLGPDEVVYANTLKAAVVAGLAARRRGLPMLMHLHDLPTAGHFTAMNRRVIRMVATHLADTVAANAQASADALRAIGARPRRLPVVYNGFDSASWCANTAPATEGVTVPEGAFCVGVFGRITPWKGQDVVIRALQATNGTHLLIVGEALFTEEDRAYGQSLRQLIDKLGLSNRVRFLGHRRDVRALMSRCDAVVHCSTSAEPFGRVVVEAQLAGRPVIAAAAGGVLEIVDHAMTGLLTPPGDHAALAQAITYLKDHPEDARALAERGRREAAERFSIQQMLTGIDDAVQEAWSRRHASRSKTLAERSAALASAGG